VTEYAIPYALWSLQIFCIYPKTFSPCSPVTPDPLHLPKCFFPMLSGHSRPPAFTQMPFPHALRSLQTPCIYPNAFSPCSSVTPDPLHLPKYLFPMLFGHSRPPECTQLPFPYALRSLRYHFHSKTKEKSQGFLPGSMYIFS
jgi:hypothetical protein